MACALRPAASGAAQPVSAVGLAAAVLADHAEMATRASLLSDRARQALAPLAAELLALGGLG